MSERLSPLTFLSLLHHTQTGRLLAADELEARRQVEARAQLDDPQDCVRRAGSVDPDMTVIEGYDLHGQLRVKIEVATKDAGWWERLAIRYMRWRFGQPLRLVK